MVDLNIMVLNLKELIDSRGFQQKDIAPMLEMTPAYLSYICSGERPKKWPLSVAFIKTLSSIIGATEDEVFRAATESRRRYTARLSGETEIQPIQAHEGVDAVDMLMSISDASRNPMEKMRLMYAAVFLKNCTDEDVKDAVMGGAMSAIRDPSFIK